MVNNRTRSNMRNIEVEKLEDDQIIVKDLLKKAPSFELRVAYIKLLAIIKILKEEI